MTQHVRAQIREFVRQQLTAIPGLEQYVFLDSEEISEDLQCPMVHVHVGAESIETTGLGDRNGRKQARQLELVVDVYCQHKSEPLQLAEGFAIAVETKLAADPRMGGLAQDLRLSAVTPSRSDGGKQPISQLRLLWTVLYFTRERDPTVPA